MPDDIEAAMANKSPSEDLSSRTLQDVEAFNFIAFLLLFIRVMGN